MRHRAETSRAKNRMDWVIFRTILPPVETPGSRAARSGRGRYNASQPVDGSRSGVENDLDSRSERVSKFGRAHLHLRPRRRARSRTAALENIPREASAR